MLAAYQQLPVQMCCRRMLNALQADGLVQQSADDPPRYLPGATLTSAFKLVGYSAQRA